MRSLVWKSLLYPPLAIALGLAVSCDTPQKRGIRELAKLGIQPSSQAMAAAASDGDTRKIGWLLDAGIPAGAAALGLAVEKDELPVIRQLLAAGANSAGEMLDGAKILPWAIRHDRAAAVSALLDSGTDPLQTDRAGDPLLLVALKAGNLEAAKRLISLGAPADRADLRVALADGMHDFLPRLTAAGADPDAADPDGKTLLASAVADRDLPAIAALLCIGADPNLKTPDSPLATAFAADDADLLAVFLRHGAKPPGKTWNQWLRNAFDKRLANSARAILATTLPAAAVDPDLLTAAVLRKDGTFVKLLADYGVRPAPALQLAAAHGDLEMTALLIATGARVDRTAFPSLETPLSAAIRGGHDRVAAMLVRAGAPADLLTPEGQPPLVLAAATGCHLTIRELLDHGVDPNTEVVLPGSAAFSKVVRPGVVRWLVKHDTNVTPLMIAADSGVIPSARALIRGGAKTETRTHKTHIWPINFASRRNDIKMMRLFLGRDPQTEERRIVIRLSEQRARMFDSEGVEIFATKVSTGKKGHATPAGEYVITNKYRDWKSTLYDAKMPYFQRLSCGDFGLHAGNVPDYPASHGCIRVPAGNAKKLFSMTRPGDRVNIVP